MGTYRLAVEGIRELGSRKCNPFRETASMKMNLKKANALREQGIGSTTRSIYFTDDLIKLTRSVKKDFLSGKNIRPVDYNTDMRSAVIGVIAALRDELPIRCKWVTLKESHQAETRLRARCYSVDGSFLRGKDLQHG